MRESHLSEDKRRSLQDFVSHYNAVLAFWPFLAFWCITSALKCRSGFSDTPNTWFRRLYPSTHTPVNRNQLGSSPSLPPSSHITEQGERLTMYLEGIQTPKSLERESSSRFLFARVGPGFQIGTLHVGKCLLRNYFPEFAFQIRRHCKVRVYLWCNAWLRFNIWNTTPYVLAYATQPRYCLCF